MQQVELVGGHFDGVSLEIDPACRLVTLEWDEGTGVWDGPDVEVKLIGVASYRRIDEKHFLKCVTPTVMGFDAEWLVLPDRQMTIEEEP
jgi:hypothetical protein